MDLSPRARERLERIGSLSRTEQEALQREHELEGILSPYFTGNATTEELWQQLKTLAETHGSVMVKQAQERIADTLRLQMSDDDFTARKDTILALETLKDSGRYSALESLLGSVVSLRQRYNDVKQQALQQARAQMEGQVQEAAEQARRQGMVVDTASAIEANIMNSPQWREFISRQDAAAQQTMDDYLSRLKAMF